MKPPPHPGPPSGRGAPVVPQLAGLVAVVRYDDGTCNQPIQLFKAFIKYREEIEQENGSLASLAKRYLTSEINEGDT